MHFQNVSPAVTLLMANHNGEAFLEDSLKSILTQTMRSIEIVVVDDASTDRSREILRAAAEQDRRIRCFTTPTQGGPAVARNVGLDHARGRWIAVMDSDDLIHPERLERLLHQAEAQGSDIAADNLLVFDDRNAVPPHAFLTEAASPRAVDLVSYVAANAHGPAHQQLGYLKPLFRADFVRKSGVRYRPELRVAEDFSFVRALLAAGARFHLMPGMTYFYRKHASSLSHTLATASITAMIADDAAFLAQQHAPDALVQACALRRRGFDTVLAFDALVRAIKHRRWAAASALALRHPAAALMLRQPVAARINRLRARPRPTASAGRQHVCIIARPVGADPGRMLAPLLHLAGLFAGAGADPHLVVLGAITARHRAALRRVPGIGVFRTVRTRPGRTEPQRTEDDCSVEEALFVARHARPLADIIVADGLPGLAAVPFVLRPGSLTLVLADASARGPLGGHSPSDLARLARADAILAMHPQDAAPLQGACGDTPIIMVPTGRAPGGQPAPLAPRVEALVAALWPGARAAAAVK